MMDDEEQEIIISEICESISKYYNSGFFECWVNGDTNFWFIFSEYINDDKKSRKMGKHLERMIYKCKKEHVPLEHVLLKTEMYITKCIFE